MALLASACGGAGGTGDTTTTTTTAAAETTTTSEASQTTTTTAADNPQVVGIGDIPQECIDAFAGFLREIEPYVADIDWENATTADLEQLGNDLEPLSSAYDDSVAGTNCDNIQLDASDEESFQFMIDMAKREAPGTVAYLEWVEQIATSVTDPGTQASGDCESDIAALQAIVDEGGTMADLPLGDLSTVSALITSISTACSASRAAEFLSQPDVAAFMNGGG
ncbi:MAG: hypothetical protein WA726_09730 [Acidimicrobiia bacterium]